MRCKCAGQREIRSAKDRAGQIVRSDALVEPIDERRDIIGVDADLFCFRLLARPRFQGVVASDIGSSGGIHGCTKVADSLFTNLVAKSNIHTTLMRLNPQMDYALRVMMALGAYGGRCQSMKSPATTGYLATTSPRWHSG
jgi:hypothetical protein